MVKKASEQQIWDYVEYLKQRGKKPRTLCEYRRGLYRLAEWLEAVYGVDDLTAADEDQMLAWRIAVGASVEEITISNYATPVRGFYRWAMRRRMIDWNPVEDLPLPPSRRRLPRPIDTTHLEYAILTAPKRIRPWLVLAAYAGFRAQEIAYLRREDILNTARPSVILVSTLMAKGGHERVVPMSPYVWTELQRGGLPRRGFAFRRFDGTCGPNSPKRVSKLANDHLRACGYDETLHQLRHWFGTASYEYSRDLRKVQELMGHRSPVTTAGYTAIVQAEAADVVNGIQPNRRGLRTVRGKHER